MTEADVANTYILEWFESFYYFFCCRVGVSFEEFDGLVDCHFEYVVDICAMEFDIEYVVFEAFAVASLTRKHEVSHKLHRNCYRTFALTHRATTAIYVKREVGRREAHLL